MFFEDDRKKVSDLLPGETFHRLLDDSDGNVSVTRCVVEKVTDKFVFFVRKNADMCSEALRAKINGRIVGAGTNLVIATDKEVREARRKANAN